MLEKCKWLHWCGCVVSFYWKYRWTLLPTTPPIVLLHQLQCHRLGDHQSSTFRVFNPVRLLMAEPVVKMSPFHFLQLDFRLASTLTLIAVSLSTLLQSCRSIVMKLIHLQTSSTPPPQGRWWSTSPPLCIQQSGLNTLSFIHLWAASTPYCHKNNEHNVDDSLGRVGPYDNVREKRCICFFPVELQLCPKVDTHAPLLGWCFQSSLS